MNLKVDTIEYVSNMRQLIGEGHAVVITVAGWSMEPFLRNRRDRVLLQKPEGRLRVGDIVFYQRETGQYILHRIHTRKADGFYMMGDHQLCPEGPIAPEAVFAVVAEVERNGRWISVENLFWKIACILWRMLYPVRKLAYAAKKGVRK